MNAQRASRSATSAKAVAAEDRQGLGHRVAWIFLVGFVPAIVAILVIGGALQVVGVPVWPTVTSLLGQKAPSSKADPVGGLEQTVASQKRTIASQDERISSDADRLDKEQQKISTLQQELSSLQKEVDAYATSAEQGATEAKVLTQMDPSAAAAVLQKMSIDDAGWVIAQMSATVSGPILQALTPATANQILQKAANDTQQIQVESTTTNSSNTSSTP